MAGTFGFLGDLPLLNILGGQKNGLEYIDTETMASAKSPDGSYEIIMPSAAIQNKGFMDDLLSFVTKPLGMIAGDKLNNLKLGGTNVQLGAAINDLPTVMGGLLSNPLGGLGTGKPGLLEGLWEESAPNTGLSLLFQDLGMKGMMPQGSLATARDAAPWAGWAMGNIFAPGIGGPVGRAAGEMAGQVAFGQEGNKKFWQKTVDEHGWPLYNNLIAPNPVYV